MTTDRDNFPDDTDADTGEPGPSRDYWIPPDQRATPSEQQPQAEPGAPPASQPGSEPEASGSTAATDDQKAREAKNRARRSAAANRKRQEEVFQSLASAFEQVRDAKKRRFLAALAVLGTFPKAAKVAEINAGTPYTRQWMDSPGFRAGVEQARAMYGAVLEAEADRRAVAGIMKPTGWHKGKPGGYIREYSDLLLIFRMKGVMPEKYRDNVHVTGALAHIDVTKLTNEQIARIRSGEPMLQVLGSAAIAQPASAALPPALRALPPARGEEGTP